MALKIFAQTVSEAVQMESNCTAMTITLSSWSAPSVASLLPQTSDCGLNL